MCFPTPSTSWPGRRHSTERVSDREEAAMDDRAAMERALALGASVRRLTSPNPWVGCVVVGSDGSAFEGATQPPGGAHAEVMALARAGDLAWGATLYTTLEPCAHVGRTGPCAQAIVAAGVSRVVMALEDPDRNVCGRGRAALTEAGVEVVVGVGAGSARDQLAPYLHHRSTGRPWVVLKLAATLDGRIAAPDGTSRWLTGPVARRDVHRLRADSDAILVGAGTVRADDPALTVRLDDPGAEGAGHGLEGAPAGAGPWPRQPLRVVLGRAPKGARVHPALELAGRPATVLEELGRRGVLQLLVEGGATVAAAFHGAGLVDRYVLYLAPALMGGDDGRPLFAGPGAATMGEVWRGRLLSVANLGGDLRIDVAPGAGDGGPAGLEGPDRSAAGSV